jgi:signal transduction histidine kinase
MKKNVKLKKKVHISLSLKLTLIVSIVAIIAISTITVFNIDIEEEKKHFFESQYDKAAALIQALNASSGTEEQIKNLSFQIENIQEFRGWYIKDNESMILKVSINHLEQDELITFASSDTDTMGKPAVSYMVNNEDYTSLCHSEDNTYYIPRSEEKPPTLIILSPINRTGETIGTYEIVLNMEALYDYLDGIIETRTQRTIFVSAIILFILIFCFLFLLRKVIVKPIITFRNTARVIGKGDLDTRVKIGSKDELGDLAEAFNEMAKDLKESRDKIQDYNRILENLLDQKDEFIGQLGHDLKNPLQPLVGLLPMLLEQEKDPDIKEALEVMNQNVEYMQNLIMETLKLAKLRSSKIKFNFENVKLMKEAQNAIASQAIHLKENKITAENKINEDIIVTADKLRLSEVFKNLIANSVKYTSETGGKITLDAWKEDDMITVSVKDTGMGMTQDEVKKVFDEFYKADRTTSEYHSTGLGLAICKRIVEKHGGKIWVDSPGKGKGTIFYFTLKKGNEK